MIKVSVEIEWIVEQVRTEIGCPKLDNVADTVIFDYLSMFLQELDGKFHLILPELSFNPVSYLL